MYEIIYRDLLSESGDVPKVTCRIGMAQFAVPQDALEETGRGEFHLKTEAAMSEGIQYDAEMLRRLEAIYTTRDVVATRNDLLRMLELRPGERVLDVGSGPGHLTYEIAKSVGPSGKVCGIDISENSLEISRARCAELPWAEFKGGDATQLPFSDGEFDVVVSTQVFEYISDTDAAIEQFYRVLRPNGRALIMATDWGSVVWHALDQGRMERVLAAWCEHCAHIHMPQELGPKLNKVGFLNQRRDVLPLFNPESHENTYSYWLIDMIASFVPGRKGVTKEEAESWAEDLKSLGTEGGYFFCNNRFVFTMVKPSTLP